ncbi:hypothetical protein [Streptomyces varsoviensis]|uniref:hypothetical protein n=1 Tax=Streptomyces varsoviensis TaxID=67373 RepID=UPI0007C5753C|nr:hypothetical protein [Streptomyces varsoviensis]
MIPFVVMLFAALIALGFAYPILWVAAALLLFALTRYGTLGGLRLRDDPGYREYRERRVRQDRYDRRFRREQALWGRRAGGLPGGRGGAPDQTDQTKGQGATSGASGGSSGGVSGGKEETGPGGRSRAR